ncbi:MAG: pLS20_p028 family conjugation system transmembrane protein, partial [Enterococcus faecalis]
DVTGFDVNERMLDPDEVENGEVLKYKLRNKQNEEGKEAVELDEGNGGVLGWLIKSMFAPKYYRWKVDWIPLIVTLGVLAFSLVISMVRVGRLGIELAFNELWANVVVFFSFRETKRAKMVLMEIVGGFVMVISIFTMYYVFIYYNSFVFATTTSIWAQLFAVVGGAWFIYDGPAIIQKTLGIDAGLSTAGSFVMGMGAKKAVDQIGSGVKTTVGAATSGTVATAGFVAGLASGNAERKNDEDANLNKFDTDNESEKNTEDTNNAPQDEPSDTQMNDPSKDVSEEPNEAVNDEDIANSKSEEDSDQETSDNTNTLDNQEKNGEDINDSAVDENGTNDGKETEDFESKNTDTETNDQNMSDYDEQENVNDDTPKNTTTANEGQLNDKKMADNEDENSKYTGESSNMEHSDSDSESESPSNSSSEPLENPFKKKVSQMVNTNKYQKNMKNPIGNQVDRYKRNKEFGQEVNEWLAQRKEQKSQQLPKEKRPKNKKG